MSKSLPPLGSRSFADQAYAAIKRDIVHGQLTPGSKLPLEILTRRYDVGMAPLREALTRLVGETFVLAESQRGFWVARLSLEELDDLSRVRALIESEAMALSIQRGDGAWREAVEVAYARLCEIERTLVMVTRTLSEEESEEWEARNQAFHHALLSACGSPLLLKLQDMTYQQSLRYRQASRRASVARRRVDDEHAAIFDAAMAGNILRAVKAIETHIDLTTIEIRRLMANVPDTARDKSVA